MEVPLLVVDTVQYNRESSGAHNKDPPPSALWSFAHRVALVIIWELCKRQGCPVIVDAAQRTVTMLRKLVLALGLTAAHAEYLRGAVRTQGRALREMNLVPEAEIGELKKKEEAQRAKAMAEAAATMEKAKAMLAAAEEAQKAALVAPAAAAADADASSKKSKKKESTVEPVEAEPATPPMSTTEAAATTAPAAPAVTTTPADLATIATEAEGIVTELRAALETESGLLKSLNEKLAALHA